MNYDASPVAVEGVTVTSLPDTGSGSGGGGIAFGLLLALLFATLIIGAYGVATWIRNRKA